MAPTKGTMAGATSSSLKPLLAMPGTRKGPGRKGNAATNNNIIDANVENIQTRSKRKADNSPIKNEKIKRSAFGNLTNNVKINSMGNQNDDQEPKTKKPTAQQLQVLMDAKNNENIKVNTQLPASKMITRAAAGSKLESSVDRFHQALDRIEEAMVSRQKIRKHAPLPLPTTKLESFAPPATAGVGAASTTKPARRISNDFNKTEESLYMSALEDISTSESMRLSGNFEAVKRRSAKIKQESQESQKTETSSDVAAAAAAVASAAATLVPCPSIPVPADVEDFDRKNWDDPFQVSHYAMDIFNYLKTRESQFHIDDYMPRQIHLNTWMRSLLVDWMVEVQETFELNHESLYLAVKIVDLYLCRQVIHKEMLQLLGAAAFFIACKYDERQPPLIDDFLYICDGAYTHDELVKMEMNTLRIIDYDLGIPLSYRFLRRYARCAKVQMPTLTLARFILELSLMDYATISFSDSKLASAALFMALRMHGGRSQLNEVVWSSTLAYYTGYQLAEFSDIVPILNAGLHRTPRATIKTIRHKYSHKIFHEVAKVPLMTNEELFQNNLKTDISIQAYNE